MYSLGNKSQQKLKGVHPLLREVIELAIKKTKQDFTVIWGVRTAEQQNALYQKGRTTGGSIVTYKDGYSGKSNHQVKADGFGHAVDLTPWPIDWDDWGKFADINDAVQEAADEIGVKVTWGGNWRMRDGAHWQLDGVVKA